MGDFDFNNLEDIKAEEAIMIIKHEQIVNVSRLKKFFKVFLFIILSSLHLY